MPTALPHPLLRGLLALSLCLLSTGVLAADARIAIAANVTAAAREIAADFQAATGHRLGLSFGGTGQLYAQISQGAPFDVLLAADQARPERAEREGLAVPGSRFTYAIGRLTLYSADPRRVRDAQALQAADLTRLAIANPITAPYGAAAVAALQALGQYDRLQPRLVQGANIAQAYQFVATGNAELGLVAYAQIVGHREGSRWLVPQPLHPPIAQDAVLLTRGADNPAARAFLDYLRGPTAQAILRRYGYSLPTTDASAAPAASSAKSPALSPTLP